MISSLLVQQGPPFVFTFWSSLLVSLTFLVSCWQLRRHFYCPFLFFLGGVTIDTLALEFRLPEAKIARLKLSISILLLQAESVIEGTSIPAWSFSFRFKSHASGLYISRRLVTARLKSIYFSHIRLSTDLKEDLSVWFQFFDQYNGRSIFLFAADLELFNDVAGSQGFAAIWRTHWLCGSWPDSWIAQKATKNLFVRALILLTKESLFKLITKEYFLP